MDSDVIVYLSETWFLIIVPIDKWNHRMSRMLHVWMLGSEDPVWKHETWYSWIHAADHGKD